MSFKNPSNGWLKLEGFIFMVALIATIFGANWLIQNWGLCPPPGEHGPCVIRVWPWPIIMAPSGVLAIGLGFTFRDLTQRRLGIKWTIVAIFIGAILSAYLNPALALASGLAFLTSELLDTAVYTPLQKRNLMGAVVASNAVGIIVDSIVFLFVAFGSLQFLLGQVVGKSIMTLVAIPFIYGLRKIDEKRNVKAHWETA